MCKPTTTKNLRVVVAALPTTTTHPTKSSASTTSTTTTTTTTTAPPPTIIKKSVSFHEIVDVCVISRLDGFAVRELFYRPEDYKRFRSESYMEVLQARRAAFGQAQSCYYNTNTDEEEDSIVVTIFRAFLGLGRRNSKRQQWIEQQQQQQEQQQRLVAARQQTRSCSVEVQQPPLSPESLLRELAFSI